MDLPRQADDAGLRLGRGGWPRGDHPGLRCGQPLVAPSSWASWSAFICLWAVNGLKKALKYDDSLDVFGVHCVGGIVGALSCAILGYKGLGGLRRLREHWRTQLGVQATAVGDHAGLVCGAVTAIAFLLIKVTIGLRPTEEIEREGLDVSEHGERAYD